MLLGLMPKGGDISTKKKGFRTYEHFLLQTNGTPGSVLKTQNEQEVKDVKASVFLFCVCAICTNQYRLPFKKVVADAVKNLLIESLALKIVWQNHWLPTLEIFRRILEPLHQTTSLLVTRSWPWCGASAKHFQDCVVHHCPIPKQQSQSIS